MVLRMAALHAPPIVVPAPWNVRLSAPGGVLKHVPGDFVVEEIPAYAPSGEGDFDYLWVEKVDVAGPVLAKEIARRLKIPRGEVGMAGMKDRRARTRQWLSVPARRDTPAEAIVGPVGQTGEIRLLEVSRHGNKLKTGHLLGNRFEVRVRERAPEGDAEVVAAVAAMAARGFVNTFGAQRFGRGDTVGLGLQVLKGRGPRDKRMKRLALSALQSSCFNHWAAERAADGLLETAIEGDVLQKLDSGGVFVCEDPATDSARVAAGELVITGPLPGSKPTRAKGAAAAREAETLAALGIREADFAPAKKLARGARRPLLVRLEGATAERDEEGLVLRFTLPAGSYATIALALACGASVGQP